MPAVTLTSTIVASANQLSTFLEGEAVVLDLNSGTYFGLADVSAYIWSLVQQPMTCVAVVDALVEEYAVERSVLEADLMTFVHELQESDLIDVR